MFSPKTVFILGAGASFDLGLPTGDDLRTDLMAVLERDGQNFRFTNEHFNQAIMQLCQQRAGHNWADAFDHFATAAVKIRYALPLAVSIDNLLHTHQDDETLVTVGKLAIATAILEKEAKSHLVSKNFILGSKGPRQRGGIDIAVTNTKEMAKTWYLPLMRLLATGKKISDLEKIFDDIAFIVFNYDQCLEHFLVNAIMNYFNVRATEAAKVVNKLNIIHPYGQVGHFHWQASANQNVISSFGSADGRLVEIADSLLTFTESAAEGVIQRSKNLVVGAETLVMMGFGFLPQNMELLSVLGSANVTRVFMTTLGIGDDDVEIVISEVGEMLKQKAVEVGRGVSGRFKPFVERGNCRSLMDHHWLRLTRQ